MANRYTNQFVAALEKAVVIIIGQVSFGSTGAPTLTTSNARSKGVLSVTRNDVGLYTFVFGSTGQSSTKDIYFNLLYAAPVFSKASSVAPSGPIMSIVSNLTNTSTASLQIQLFDYAGVAADPASGETARFMFVFSNSSAP